MIKDKNVFRGPKTFFKVDKTFLLQVDTNSFYTTCRCPKMFFIQPTGN